ASVRALKMHGGMDEDEIGTPNLEYLEKGFSNLDKHIENLKKFGVPVIVAINRFPTDSDDELNLVKEHCDKMGVRSAHSRVFAEGGKGGVDLAKAVIDVLEKEKPNFKVLYDEKLPIKKKIEIIAKEIYGADGVVYTGSAPSDIAAIERAGNDKLPICMAKTQLSITDDPAKKGAPKGWVLTVREVRLSAGAGFIVPLTGKMMTIPGLPTVPVAERIDIDDKGHITGLS
ncbi:MAG: formate--tetrahydrofolate ligase, partial [Thermoplasmata archaeon]